MALSKEIQALQDRLNTDAKLRGELLKDPVKVLKREGVEVSADSAKSLKAQFDEMQLSKIPTIPPQLKFPKIKIGIKISVSF